MRNSIKFLLIAMLAGTAVTACSDSDYEPGKVVYDDNTITTGLQNITTNNVGGEYTITIHADRGEWRAYSEDSWATVQLANTNKSDGTVVVKVAENTEKEARNTNIVVMARASRKKIAVSQSAKEVAPDNSEITAPEGYTLVWNDEFNGTTLSNDWTREQKPAGWVNNELQNYTDDGTTIKVSDGRLYIQCYKAADGKIYSGRVYGKEAQGFKYGIFEAKIKLPKGKGTWPAFWMMPANNDFAANPWPKCGEIDIMEEVGYHPDYTSSSIHCQAYNHNIGTQKTAERLTSGAESDFHVYRLEWTADYIKTYVDGNLLLTFDNDGKGDVNTWPFDKPFYPILNLAWGGMWGGQQGVDERALPVTMEVEYVRVFQKN